MNMFDITGKKAIVTGAAQGLGYGMAEGLMEAGCQVVIIDYSPKTADVAAAFTQKGYTCYGIQADLSIREENYRAFDEALEKLGGDLDIMVPAAGIQRRNSAENFLIEDWDAVININLHSVFIMCQLAGRVMLKKGYGKIINIASMISFFGGQTIPAYAAAKGGVAQLTKEMSNDWAGRGVCVNALAPGYMDTEMNVGIVENKERFEQISARIPAGRWGTGKDMQGPLIFLASSASDYITGCILPVDGGYLVK